MVLVLEQICFEYKALQNSTITGVGTLIAGEGITGKNASIEILINTIIKNNIGIILRLNKS
jgi:hypothetical protein